MSNYYDDILKKIKDLYEQKEYLKASMIIDEELNMPFVPSDFEEKLLDLKDQYSELIKDNALIVDDDDLAAFLFADPYKQLIAANYLDGLNLRNYLDLIDRFLRSDGDRHAKSLLIASLIDQGIKEKMTLLDNDLTIEFIPEYCEPIAYQDGYIKARSFFKEALAKNPSLLNMAEDLLTSECFLHLPISLEEDEGLLLAQSIVVYLYECLGDIAAKEAFINDYGISETRLYRFDPQKMN